MALAFEYDVIRCEIMCDHHHNVLFSKPSRLPISFTLVIYQLADHQAIDVIHDRNGSYIELMIM